MLGTTRRVGSWRGNVVGEPDHRIEVRFDQDHIHLEAVCHAPQGAECRLKGPPGCTCEEWTIERAHGGAQPYHKVDTIGGATILHWMEDSDECNTCTWLNESGAIAELNGAKEQFLIASLPIEPIWEGDHYQWKRITK